MKKQLCGWIKCCVTVGAIQDPVKSHSDTEYKRQLSMRREDDDDYDECRISMGLGVPSPSGGERKRALALELRLIA